MENQILFDLVNNYGISIPVVLFAIKTGQGIITKYKAALKRNNYNVELFSYALFFLLGLVLTLAALGDNGITNQELFTAILSGFATWFFATADYEQKVEQLSKTN